MTDPNDHRMLLVLDLDETLICATEKKMDDSFNFRMDKYFVYLRQGLKEFLSGINKYIKLGFGLQLQMIMLKLC